MVSILSTYTVIPSEATPNCSLLLSESEQINAPTHAFSIYVYKPCLNKIPNMLDTMRHSLAKILVHYYPLAGRLRMIEGRRWEVECNAKGVQLLEGESRRAVDDYGDFEPNDTIEDLIPKVDYTKPIEKSPLLLVQLTRFSCGGFCVGIAISNVIVDGIAGTHFINSWATLARGGTLEEHDMPLLNKMVLSSDTKPHFDHREFKPLPLVLGHSDTTEESKKETALAMLKLTRDMVEKLKKKANEGNEGPSYSRFECISAHIWRSVVKARDGDYNQPTLVHIVAGARNRLDPPIPLNYFGNATYPTVTPTCLGGDIVSKPLSYVAQKIREAIEVLTNEYLRSGFGFIGRENDVGWLRGNDHGGKVEPLFLGNPNLNIWSWMSNMPLYGPDFGYGRAVYMGPGVVKGDGRAFIMPGSAGNGSVLIAIRLQNGHVEAFKEFFHKDL
ncbi:Spermidine hydroxycinnamoyl transferase, partial [Mucuna pruriens]